MVSPRLLVLIEDNPNDELLTVRALRRNNITNPLVILRDGAQALEYLFGAGAYAGRNVRETPAVILLDLKLPKIDGLEVLQHLRADPRTRPIPVVVLTSSLEEQDIRESYALGANSYLRKPVEFEGLVQAVQQLGQYWLVLNEPPPAPLDEAHV